MTKTLASIRDELGWWGDVLMRSMLPGEKTNVYTPEQYPAGWEAVVST